MKVNVTDRANGRRRVSFETEGESRTEQNHANEVNINSIVRRYQKTGVMSTASGTPSYGDFSGVVDYHTALDAVRHAEDMFMSLPAELRKRFGNDPGALVGFLEDAGNLDEAIELGLVERPPEAGTEPPAESEEAPSGEPA